MEKNLFTPSVTTDNKTKVKIKDFETQYVPNWCKPKAYVYEECDYERFITFDTNRYPDHIEGLVKNIKSRGYIKTLYFVA